MTSAKGLNILYLYFHKRKLKKNLNFPQLKFHAFRLLEINDLKKTEGLELKNSGMPQSFQFIALKH